MRKRRGYVKSGITLQQLIRCSECPIEIHFFNDELGKEYGVNIYCKLAGCAIDDEHLAKEVVLIETNAFNSLEIWVGDEWLNSTNSLVDYDGEEVDDTL